MAYSKRFSDSRYMLKWIKNNSNASKENFDI